MNKTTFAWCLAYCQVLNKRQILLSFLVAVVTLV